MLATDHHVPSHISGIVRAASLATTQDESLRRFIDEVEAAGDAEVWAMAQGPDAHVISEELRQAIINDPCEVRRTQNDALEKAVRDMCAAARARDSSSTESD